VTQGPQEQQESQVQLESQAQLDHKAFRAIQDLQDPQEQLVLQVSASMSEAVWPQWAICPQQATHKMMLLLWKPTVISMFGMVQPGTT
jgi:hypothetical protein